MKSTITLDIGATHLTATLKPRAPGWGLRAARAVGAKLRYSRYSCPCSGNSTPNTFTRSATCVGDRNRGFSPRSSR